MPAVVQLQLRLLHPLLALLFSLWRHHVRCARGGRAMPGLLLLPSLLLPLHRLPGFQQLQFPPGKDVWSASLAWHVGEYAR